ncbi:MULTISPECIES: hypothetical protein [unclassified Variovorax]|uniref:hypothetical protein n=1 Tax=unclassified Variovorax TaxID=663243 RepID=UPI0008BB27EC|nr:MULTISPECIES: hypothetical protein [unclassified Variovorax]SEK17176.1 hypothetical protein SAMN05518853_13715 [Variovorax sp. OK202]SFE74810.1 hypothetical protein SAMN05444746_13615 [Variovorax sp. OK212]
MQQKYGDASRPLEYLLQLLRTRLPVDVIDANELKVVSLLKATGLIEAQLASSGAAKNRYWGSSGATVTRITEHGMAELARMSLDLLRSSQLDNGRSLTPLAYLRRLESGTFPVRVEDGAAVSNIVLLKAAALLDATIGPISPVYPDNPQHALVLRITPLGREELARRAVGDGASMHSASERVSS